jgi:hypothetical protein
VRSVNALKIAAARRARSFIRLAGLTASRARRASRAISGRNSVSWVISLFAVRKPASSAIASKVFRSTVLPTPRRPVISMLFSGRPSLRRASRIRKASISSSRPVSAGGREPAPGV